MRSLGPQSPLDQGWGGAKNSKHIAISVLQGRSGAQLKGLLEMENPGRLLEEGGL